MITRGTKQCPSSYETQNVRYTRGDMFLVVFIRGDSSLEQFTRRDEHNFQATSPRNPLAHLPFVQIPRTGPMHQNLTPTTRGSIHKRVSPRNGPCMQKVPASSCCSSCCAATLTCLQYTKDQCSNFVP